MSAGWLVVVLTLIVVAGLVWLLLWQFIRLDGRWGTEGWLISIRWLGFHWDYDSRSTKLRWGRWQIRSGVRRPVAASPQSRAKKPKKPQQQAGRRWWRQIDLAPDLVRAFWRGVCALVEELRLERCRVQVQIGTPDPALTGMLFGYATAARAVLASCFPQVQLELQPDFETGRSRTEGEVQLAVRPLHLIRVGVGVFRALPKRRLWRAMRQARRERKTKGGVPDGTPGSAQDVSR